MYYLIDFVATPVIPHQAETNRPCVTRFLQSLVSSGSRWTTYQYVNR
jgi:hypothetical protein